MNFASDAIGGNCYRMKRPGSIWRIVLLAAVLVLAILALGWNWWSRAREAQVPQVDDLAGTFMPGEARVLSGTRPVQLTYAIDALSALYGYDDDGTLVTYVRGRDYTLREGRLARTAHSSIPDFDDHRVQRDRRGRFQFGESPRSPQLVMPFTVYARYPTGTAFVIRPNGALANAEQVVCLGDSITAGAHTVAQVHFQNRSGAYCALLEKNLAGETRFLNRGAGGATLDLIDRNLDDLVPAGTDAALIAFGMNDHVRGEAGLIPFRQKLDRAVRLLREREISPILVGFFQQNPDWVKEDVAMTRAYNRAICEVAQANGVPFVDMKRIFERAVPDDRTRIAHLTGDFIHHPNEFGQRLYMSALLPFFLQEPRQASQFPDFVPLPGMQDAVSEGRPACVR